MRILIVDDEKQLCDALEEILKAHKYSVDSVYNGEDGLEYALTGVYDVVVLDIMLPKINGLSILKRLRDKKISTPVLLLSAKSEIGDRISGLDTGADDYLTKPFAAGELLARIRALTRRRGEFLGDIIGHKGISLNKNTFDLTCEDKSIKLSAKEFAVMELLVSNPSVLFSKEHLIEKIWGYDFEGEYNTVEVYISFLRKKLAAIGSPVEIKSLRGRGYCLEDGNDTKDAD